eukprot:15365420-Ditylum_brightwellii.AAC.2
MQKGDFIMVMGGNGALGQAVIQLASKGGAGGIYATAQKENACVITESYVGATLPMDLLPPKQNLYA